MTFMFMYTTPKYGGWLFVKVDTDKKTVVEGDSGSTAESFVVDMPVRVATKKELEEIRERFLIVFDYENLGRK